MLCFACGNYNIVLTCHIYTHTYMGTNTQTHTHTHTHTHTQILPQIRGNAGPQNLIHRNSCFSMKTLDLRKLLGKLREIN